MCLNISSGLGIRGISSNSPSCLKKVQGRESRIGPKRFLAVKNEFVFVGFLKVFEMNFCTTVADGSCTTDFCKTRIESFWNPHSQGVDPSFLDMSWDFRFGNVSKGIEIMLWVAWLPPGKLISGCLTKEPLACWAEGGKTLKKWGVCFSCLYWGLM